MCKKYFAEWLCISPDGQYHNISGFPDSEATIRLLQGKIHRLQIAADHYSNTIRQ